MEGLGTGISLESMLQETQQHTILLSDIRENSEISRKTDEKTLTQLQKLQQASTQTLEVAKAHKKQAKDESTTLKALHETTVNANAIIAKHQTSTLNNLCKTVDAGLTATNQKMFSMMEKLGTNLAGAFASVGRGLENKLYGFFGNLSFLIRPIVGVVKFGFSSMAKIIEVPLKMMWDGLKAFSNTLIGKLTTLAIGAFLLYKFVTSTKFGEMIYEHIHKKVNDPNSMLGKIYSSIATVGKIILGAWGVTKAYQIAMLAKTSAGLFKGIGSLVTSVLARVGIGEAAAGTAAGAGGAAMLAGTAGTAALASMSKNDLRRYINAHGGNITNKAAGGMSREAMLAKATALNQTPAAASKLSNVGKYVNMGGKAFKIGGGIGGMLGGAALDFAADKVENQTASGLLNVGSAALSGAAMGAMFGPIGAAVGGILGAGASLIAGEGGKKIFGKNEDENELSKLDELQQVNEQASTAQIKSLNDIAEAIRDTNKTMTKVIEKYNTDAQNNIQRRESNTAEQVRHEDAKTQQDLTATTNDTLKDIKDAIGTLANNISLLVDKLGNTNGLSVAMESYNIK